MLFPLGSPANRLLIQDGETGNETPMSKFAARDLPPKLPALLVAGLLSLASQPTIAADDTEAAPKGAAVTVLKAAKTCFSNTVEVSGTIIPRDETQVRPERMGLKVADVMVDAGDTVTAGQTLARLNAAIGATASGKGEALFSIIARSEFDLVGLVPTRDIAKLAVNQTAAIKVIGAGDVDGRVRRLSTTVEPNSQLGQVFVGITTNRRLLVYSSGRAKIKTGQSCGVSVPLTAILYTTAGTVVQVIRRDRVETRQVETGLMSAGQVEIRRGIEEGEIVVARAGALLREGDPVRPVTAAADVK